MESSPHTRRRLPRTDDFTRTGALWVTGTGAFMLVVASAIFVAVRWDQMPEASKLAVLGALSGSALLAGRRLRRRLPATGAVLYHLGAFLLPVVAAAVAVRFDAGWQELLLIEGVTGTVVFTALERVERSVVLRTAAAISVVVAALGMGANAGVVPSATLAAAAVVAEVTRRRHLATFWALVGGFAPAVALAAPLLSSTTVLDELALTGATASRLAIASAVVAAGVLLVEARARRDLVLLVSAGAALGLGAVTTWVDLSPAVELAWLASALAFLAVELTAWFVRRDAFLAAPARVTAIASEVGAAVVTLTLAVPVLIAPRWFGDLLDPGIDGRILTAAIVAATAWLIGDMRRRVEDNTPQAIALLVGSGWWPATFGIAATVVVGVAIGTASAPATAITMTGLAAIVVLSGRPFGHATAGWLVLTAVLAATDQPTIACACAFAGMLVLCAAAIVRARQATPDIDDAYLSAAYAWSLAGLAILTLLVALPIALGPFDDLWVLVGWVGACWTAAVALDRAPRRGPTRYLGSVGRVSSLAVVLAALFVGAEATAVTFAIITILGTIDAMRRREIADGLVAAAAGPIALAATVLALDGSTAMAAIVLSVTTLLVTVASVAIRPRWRPVAVALAAWATTLAMPMGATDAAAFATVLLFTGAALVVAAVDRRSGVVGAAGGAVTSLGIWSHLDAAGVEATDAYVAPVAAGLLVAGFLARQRDGLTSWAAYGPAIGLLGAAALAERFASGSGVHALAAGIVGTVAVAVGGWRRLAAPLLLGTALLVAVVVSETMAYTATMPTWGWLALGGAALVAAGIAMERAEVGPIETGRRVLDVVHDRFA